MNCFHDTWNIVNVGILYDKIKKASCKVLLKVTTKLAKIGDWMKC